MILKLKNHYKTYCRSLSEVIKTAKKLYYNKLIINSNNKAKSIWNTVKTVTKKTHDDGAPLNTDGKTFKDYQRIAYIFNTYFTNAIDNMSVNNSMTMNATLNYFYQVLTRPFPHIKLTPVSTREISEIIKSLKWKNAHGYDEIPIKILKISLPFIISLLFLSLSHTHTHTHIYIYIYVCVCVCVCVIRCPLAYFLYN